MELKRLGWYEVVARLGAGGMGEVYRATDTKLGRDVAVKILPASFTNDPERVARFRREAQVLASLNHPHIAQIYGLDEANGTQFLVLELVDGESLDKRIARGSIPLDEAFTIARQIAEALEAAHEKGIIHRDLKPANVALTKDGTVKVLDFGLAKAVENTAALADPANSPTITSPLMMTGLGVILGTAAYMSPEQAKGRAADKRSDIWSFGCVMYEMLAGRRAFQGEDVSETLANVLREAPAWGAVPQNVPQRVRDVMHRCLAKDRSQRLRDIGDARLELADADGAGTPAASGARRARSHRTTSMGMFVAGAAIAAVVAWRWFTRSPVAVAPVTRWMVSLPADAPLDVSGPWSSLAISRDGRMILYVARTGNGRELFLRRADDLTPHLVGGTVGVWEAFFSPDGGSIGFIAADQLKRVAVTGGQPVTIADVPNFNSGVWADDGAIYVGGRAGLAKISSDGRLTQLARPASNEGRLVHPDLLPDGTLLFTIEPNDVTSFDDARIAVLSPNGMRRVVLEGGDYARYSPTGHIVYVHGGHIMAVPFDVRGGVEGQPVAVVAGGSFDVAAGAAFFAVSRTGVLAYVPGGPLIKQRSIAWADRHGSLTPIAAPPRFYAEPSISPDQRKIVFTLRAANDDVWTYDIARGSFARLTFPKGNNEVPIWSPDGRRVVYAVDRDGVRRLVWRPADGSGTEEPLTPAEYFQTTGSWSPDGRLLAFTEDRPQTGSDIFILPLDGKRSPIPLMASAVNERSPMFSPDGHWIAYASDETGRFEVFVAPYPAGGQKWQISDGGGVAPAWRRDGREIVYQSGERVMSVTIDASSPPASRRPVQLFKLPPHTEFFAMAPDGQRFVVVFGDGTGSTAHEFDVVLNWFEELKARVPTASP